jgi:HPt (histidine-containing phosphotransfer) domain-containing protein
MMSGAPGEAKDGASAALEESSANGMDASTVVVDRAALLKITGNDEELATEFLRRFRNQQESLVLPVKHSLDDIDMAAIKTAAHRLKGAARTIGAAALSL